MESLCSGSQLGSNLSDAVNWIRSHGQEMHDQALANEQSEYGGGRYDHPNGFCRYYAGENVAIYETTRGTVFSITRSEDGEDQFEVSIPKHRALGFHRSTVELARRGYSSEEIDNFNNIHRFEGMELVNMIIKSWDAHNEVLAPLGYAISDFEATWKGIIEDTEMLERNGLTRGQLEAARVEIEKKLITDPMEARLANNSKFYRFLE